MKKQTVVGHFYSYIKQGRRNGESIFHVIPEQKTDGTVNGILRCHGRVKLYSRGMPIAVTGELNKGTFYVETDCVPSGTRESVFSILGYIAKNLTEKSKQKIADYCGNDLFSFCREDGSLQVFADAIGDTEEKRTRAMKLFRKLRSLLNENSLEEKLLSYGIPFETSLRMSRKGITLESMQKSPYYILIKNGVPFSYADVIARREWKVPVSSMSRLKGLTMAALDLALKSGNTCLNLPQLAAYADRITKGAETGMPESLALMNACVAELPNYCQYHEVTGKQYIYLNHVWDEESMAVQGIRRLCSSSKIYEQIETIEETEAALGIHYNTEQRQAFELLKIGGIKIMTGPPGTGKTAVLKGLIRNFTSNCKRTFRLAATTGMAAKVMQASTGEECETVHKMLRIVPYHDSAYGRGRNDPLNADLVIVDEVSMMGLQVFSILIQAVKNGAILLLVGDEDQLQSVEYGNILHDLIESGCAEVCRLKQCIRNKGLIYENGKRINEGRLSLSCGKDFRIKELDRKSFYQDLISEYELGETQIICPINAGQISVNSLNRTMQEEVNAGGEVAALSGAKFFRVGDKIIFQHTDYQKGYINGDMGMILSYSPEGEMLVELSDGRICVDREDYCNMDLAYAVTVHKSEGSTYRKVIIVLPEEAQNMMSRRLLYTAVTRASESVLIYSENEAVDAAIENRRETIRQTCLANRTRVTCKK